MPNAVAHNTVTRRNPNRVGANSRAGPHQTKTRALARPAHSPLPAEWMGLAIAWAVGFAVLASPAFGQVADEGEPIVLDVDESLPFSLKYTEQGDLVRWADKEFTLSLAPNTQLSDARVRRDLVSALAEWETTGVAPRIELDANDSTVRDANRDGVNSIFFVEEGWEFDPDIVALTFTHIRSRDGVIVEMDMAINAEFYNFDAGDAGDDGERVHDLQSVFTHEIGHAFGLPDFPRAPEATMYSVLDAGTVHPRELDEIDFSAIEALYEAGFEEPAEKPSGNCPNAPPTTFALLLLGLGLRRRLRRLRHLAPSGLVAVVGLSLMSSPAGAESKHKRRADVSQAFDDAEGEAGGVVIGREAPRHTNGLLPATDLLIRTGDGSLVRVRVPGKATGEIQPRVLHQPIPDRGEEIVVPSFVQVRDRPHSR